MPNEIRVGYKGNLFCREGGVASARRHACRWPARQLILAVPHEGHPGSKHHRLQRVRRSLRLLKRGDVQLRLFPDAKVTTTLDAQSCSRLFGRNTSTEEAFPPTRIGGVADEEAVGNGGRRRIDDQLWRGVSPKTSGNAAARNHGPGDEFRGSMVRATSNLGQRVPGRAFENGPAGHPACRRRWDRKWTASATSGHRPTISKTNSFQ